MLTVTSAVSLLRSARSTSNLGRFVLCSLVHLARGKQLPYDPDEFIRLTDAVEAQGGASLPDACVGEEYHLKVPAVTGPEWRDYRTTHCSEFTRFVIPYDTGVAVEVPQGKWSGVPGKRKLKSLANKKVEAAPQKEIDAQILRGARFVTVCASDDLVALWPRFANKEN